MSLKNALAHSFIDIEVKNGILIIQDVDNQLRISTTYSCFLSDIEIYHAMWGKGEVIDYNKGKWIIDFPTCSSLQEFNNKTFLNCLPN